MYIFRTSYLLLSGLLWLYLLSVPNCGAFDSNSELVKITTSIVITNSGTSPMTSYLIDCDDRDGQVSRLSHIEAKMSNVVMPVSRTDDGRYWRIDLSSRPVNPSARSQPLVITKVFTHLELVPSHDVYLVPYSNIHYHVRIIKEGRAHSIKVPSEQYYLEVDNPDLIELDAETSTLKAIDEEGDTKVRFIDRTVMSDEDFKQPEATIHIVQPSYLTMHVTPGEQWTLQKFTDYLIEIRIFDANHHRIHPSDNLDIQMTFPSEIFLTNSSVNGTLHSIRTLKTGPCHILASLLGTQDRPLSLPVELVQDAAIFDQLEVKPSFVLLPWIHSSRLTYKVNLYAAGSTGNYRWMTNDTQLIEISTNSEDSSVVEVTTRGEGTSLVSCHDTHSPVFTKHAIMSVARIAEISVLPSVTETGLEGVIFVPIAVYANVSSIMPLPTAGTQELDNPLGPSDYSLRLFDDCSQIKFNVDIVEKARFVFEENEIIPNIRAKSCRSLKFTCKQVGHSRIWIAYQGQPETAPLRATTIISCFKPLRQVYPDSLGVLAVDTSIEVAFEGGPRPFVQRIEDHYTRLSVVQLEAPKKSPIVSYEPIIDKHRHNKDLHVFRVTCLDLGKVELTLNVGNNPSPNLPNPASSKASIRIECAKPDSVTLRPKLKESCPLNDLTLSTNLVFPVSAKRHTEVELLVHDEVGRRFLNISSLKMDWSLMGPAKLIATSDHTIQEEINAALGYRRLTRAFVAIQPTGQEEYGRLRVCIQNYSQLAADVELQFVNAAYIHPNRAIIYNHFKNAVSLKILKGSGHFSIDTLLGSKYANVTYTPINGDSARITVVPRNTGKFMIKLEDFCIDTNDGALSEITVANSSDFHRFLNTGTQMQFCEDVDPSMFCLYLSILPTQARPPRTTTAVPTTTTVAPVLIQRPTTSLPSTTSVPVVPETTTNPGTITEQLSESDAPTGQKLVLDESSSLKNYFFTWIAVAITALAVILGMKSGRFFRHLNCSR